VTCGVCEQVIGYDAKTSWWMANSRVPGCYCDDEGRTVEHVPTSPGEDVWTVERLSDLASTTTR
jgi:hypothetical protein